VLRGRTDRKASPCRHRVNTGRLLPVRLFIAVGLPPPITRLLSTLPRPDDRRFRWTTPAQWHITLRFLGEIDPVTEVAEAVGEAASRCNAGEFVARLGPETQWFSGRRILQVPVAGLDKLAGSVRDLTAGWGMDDRLPFAGHVTLARVRGRGPGPAELAGVPVAAHFPVTHLTVFASSLGPGPAVYEVVAEVPVGSADHA
jgi:RNA 2',3'-cyclic 3'-phosphodiesterase